MRNNYTDIYRSFNPAEANNDRTRSSSPPSRFTRANPGRAAFLAELRALLHDQGFFYLTGHGVDPALITETLAVAKRFFALPRALLSPEELAATGPANTY